MKFKNLLFMTILAFGFVLGGCSSASNDDPNVDSEVEMRTVTVDGIDYEVPANPQRVIAFEGYVGSAIALDVPVVGTVFREGYDYSYLGDLEGVENVGAPISVEKALELVPDLIVTYDPTNLEQLQEAFSGIAPVVFIPYGFAGSVQEEITLLGEVFNKQEEAAAWVEEFEAEAAELREKLAEVIPADATFGLYETSGGSLFVYGDNFGRGGQAIYNALGLQAPERIVEDVINGDNWLEISYEVLPEFAADFMFVTQFQSTSEETIDNLIAQNSVWATLDAVQNNQVFLNDFNTFIHFDPMAVRQQMHLIADMLIERAEENAE